MKMAQFVQRAGAYSIYEYCGYYICYYTNPCPEFGNAGFSEHETATLAEMVEWCKANS